MRFFIAIMARKAIQLNDLMRGKDLSYEQAVNYLNAQSRPAHSFMPPPLQVLVVVAEQEYTLTLPKIKRCPFSIDGGFLWFCRFGS